MATEQELTAACCADPGDFEAWMELSRHYCQEGDFEKAVQPASLAVSLASQYGAAWNLYGSVLGQVNRLPEAKAALDTALRLCTHMPAAHWNRSFVNLGLGRYPEGFADYEWGAVNRMRRVRTILHRPWDGDGMLGTNPQTLLLWAEQGRGDTLQFVRYVEWAKELWGGRVVLEVQPDLVALLDGQTAADRVFAWHEDGSDTCEYDEHCSLMSLPHLMNLAREEVTGAPYLKAKGKVNLPGAARKVGLIWEGHPMHPNDRRRSLPVEALQPILSWNTVRNTTATREGGLRFYSLRPGQENIPDECEDLGADNRDWLHTAALLESLDLLICCDTGAAHLAGALGRPCWVLLHSSPDWRWGTEGERTPWYDSLRLFRQETPGEWGPVVERVAAELQREFA